MVQGQSASPVSETMLNIIKTSLESYSIAPLLGFSGLILFRPLRLKPIIQMKAHIKKKKQIGRKKEKTNRPTKIMIFLKKKKKCIGSFGLALVNST